MIATPLTLSGFLDRIYAIQRPLAVETLRQYQMSVALFERWSGGPVPLADLDELAVSEWLRDLALTRSPATCRSKRTQIVALWRAAADDGLCDPPRRRIRSVRVPWTPPVAWTYDEVRLLVAAAETIPRWHSCGLRRAAWWSLAIRVAWDTALRWGDMVALRVDQIGIDGTIAIAQSKTGRQWVGRLSPSTLSLARETIAHRPRGVLLPWRGSHETFAAQFGAIVRRAGVRPGTWKWLRRGSATDAELAEPGAGARQLGHRPGSRIAELSYLDPLILGRVGRRPREIG